jgi:hypothetical protein
MKTTLLSIAFLAFAPGLSAAGDADLSALLEKRIAEARPTAEERALDRIGWARDIREARRLSRESGRPVFLFTHDGRINTGRC